MTITNDLSTLAGTANNFNSTITAASNGNIGIGTTSPDYKLTIQNSDAAISLKDSGGTTRGYIGIAGIDGAAPTGALRFRSDQGGFLFSQSGSPTAKLDSSGRFTKPYQPYLRAVTSTTAQSLTGGQTYVIPYNVISAQNGSNYNNSTYRFTCPVAGQYFVSASVEGSSITTNYYNLFLRINGNGFAGTYVTGRNVAYEQISTTGIVSASAGDYIDVALFVNQTGGNLELNPGDVRNSLHIYLLG